MSSRLNELIGVLKGLQKVNQAFVRKCPPLEVSSLTNNLPKQPNFDDITIFSSKTTDIIYNAASNFGYQTAKIVQYKLSNVKSDIEKGVTSVQQEINKPGKPDITNNQYVGMREDHNNYELDEIDKQMLTDFRKNNPDIIQKYTDNKNNISPNATTSSEVFTENVQIKDDLSTTKKNKLQFSKTDFNLDIQNYVHEGHERRVPSNRVSRSFSFASMFAKVGVGAAFERTKNVFDFNEKNESESVFLSDSNLKIIVDSLCKMRGAALKLGQIMSIQDDEFVDPRLQKIFERVRQNADFMPLRQMNSVIVKELGEDWRDNFIEFDNKPFAAASIGQVHKAVLKDGQKVAIKIQYPGIKQSIDSDINNLMSLLRFMNVFPPGMHIDKAIEVAKRELHWECDYKREAKYAEFFQENLSNDEVFVVPKVFPEISTEQVLTMEYVEGVSLDRCKEMNQEIRDWVGTQMLRLCLIELFELFTMQTDPNWSNFLFNLDEQKIYLLDFGASRPYDKKFIDDYIEVIKAASVGNREGILKHSRNMGFLTGHETRTMENAHIDAVSILGEVFTEHKYPNGEPIPFDFGVQTTTGRIKRLIPVMLKERLTAPPVESYSIHRKLSGGFLLCTRLKSRVSCQDIFRDIYNSYQFG